MDDFERVLNEAVCGDGGIGEGIPGAAVVVADREGQILYSYAAGTASVDPKNTKPMRLDTVCYIASMTKLVTSICAMQCVERGLIGLDDGVSDAMPEWKDAEIIEGFEEGSGKPILRKAKNKITLRHLLTHTSGMGYDLVESNLLQWRAYRGESPKAWCGSVHEGYFLPLCFEPGEGWKYGASTDWAGKLVERLNGNVRLGEYMQKHIFDPLGMNSTTYNVTTRPDLAPRLASLANRINSGDFVPVTDPVFPPSPVDDCGGCGLYSTVEDYIKLLIAVLTRDERILGCESLEEMLRPQLKENGADLMKVLEDPFWRTWLASNFPEGLKCQHGLAGVLNLEETPTGRKPGSISWLGMPNLFWWVDYATGVCGAFFAQVTPLGDAGTVNMFTEFEKGVYRMVTQDSEARL
ncbi:MAG: hypothetical protein M1840_004262 [Geoglossum simile]|nr:MAG: hypothetical protein M1840_004262 [Geoglossum simile]